MSDVALADRPEQRIRNRVAEHVGIGMSLQPAIVRNLDAAENEFSPLAQADEHRNQFHIDHIVRISQSITPLDATMLYLSFMSVARFHLDLAAGGLHEKPAGGDVPEADSLFDVGVETSAGHVGHVERGAAHAAGTCAPGAPFPGAAAGPASIVTPVFESPTEMTASARSARSLTRNGLPFKVGWLPFCVRPDFVAHRIVDHADNDFALETQRNRNTEMRNAVEIIYRAVERIDDPLMIARLVADDSLFAIKRVLRKFLRAAISVINSWARTSISSLMSCAVGGS